MWNEECGMRCERYCQVEDVAGTVASDRFPVSPNIGVSTAPARCALVLRAPEARCSGRHASDSAVSLGWQAPGRADSLVSVGTPAPTASRATARGWASAAPWHQERRKVEKRQSAQFLQRPRCGEFRSLRAGVRCPSRFPWRSQHDLTGAPVSAEPVAEETPSLTIASL